MARKKNASVATAAAAPVAPVDAEKLRELNNLLLKDTKKKREQVAQLEARLGELAFENDFLAGAERELGGIVLAALLTDARCWAVAAERRSETALAEKSTAEKRALALESDMSFVTDALRDAWEKVRQVSTEKEAATRHSDSLVKNLERKSIEASDLEKKVEELRLSLAENEKNLVNLETERAEVAKEKMATERAVELLLSEKLALEKSTGNYKSEILSLKLKLEEEIKKIELLNAEKETVGMKLLSAELENKCVLDKNTVMESELISAKSVIRSMTDEVQILQFKLGKMVGKCDDADAEIQMLKLQYEELMVKHEKVLASEAEMMEAVRELEHLRKKISEVEQEKGSVEAAKCAEECEVMRLHGVVEKLIASMDELKDNYAILQGERDLQGKTLQREVAENVKLRARVDELAREVERKDEELSTFSALVCSKDEKIGELNKDLVAVQLAVMEVQRKSGGGIWSWLYPATTSLLAVLSVAYAYAAKGGQ